jgi:hypothetical protein
MLEPRPLNTIAHPFVDFTYIKKEFGGKDWEDVLVIETRQSEKLPQKERERQFFSFLADLDLIKDQVERKAGKFDRIDIKYR